MVHLVRHGSGGRGYLAVHGWGGSHHTFDPLLPYLAADASLWAPDCPGYGASPAPEWTRAAYREQMLQVIDRVPAERFTFVGNCSGAILGLDALLQRRERVERVVLLDPFAYVPWYFALFLIPVFGRVAFWSTFANPLGRWLTNAGLRRHRTGRADLTGSFASVDPGSAWATLRLLGEIATVDAFGVFQVPTVILHGERTFGAVRRSLRLWRAIWPHAQVVELAGAGHLPLQEQPERVAQAIFRGGT